MDTPIGDTGWTLHTWEGSDPRVSRDATPKRNRSADAEIYGGDVCIEHEVDAGYNGVTSNERLSIPLPALLALLRANGYKIREPGPDTRPRVECVRGEHRGSAYRVIAIEPDGRTLYLDGYPLRVPAERCRLEPGEASPLRDEVERAIGKASRRSDEAGDQRAANEAARDTSASPWERGER